MTKHSIGVKNRCVNPFVICPASLGETSAIFRPYPLAKSKKPTEHSMFKPRFGYLAVVAIALQFCGNSLFAQSVPGEIPGLQKTRKPANKVNLGPTTGLGADKQGRIYIVSNTRNRVYR
ncbi:MAG TPA: hypothetical protein PKZ53_07665, partial [Acidobacteriota bacterium]|nr:hypothetical protein [Acidobacteriota bacterium]